VQRCTDLHHLARSCYNVLYSVILRRMQAKHINVLPTIITSLSNALKSYRSAHCECWLEAIHPALSREI